MGGLGPPLLRVARNANKKTPNAPIVDTAPITTKSVSWRGSGMKRIMISAITANTIAAAIPTTHQFLEPCSTTLIICSNQY